MKYIITIFITNNHCAKCFLNVKLNYQTRSINYVPYVLITILVYPLYCSPNYYYIYQFASYCKIYLIFSNIFRNFKKDPVGVEFGFWEPQYKTKYIAYASSK